tara:strand:- start:424 stop:846 length:423 start_codon:yes stop_codon:yes gene_type:complete
MKTAKITNIEQKPEFKTNDGKTLYVFELELDNGDKGAIFKQKDNPYVEVGQEITYELTDRGSIKIQREGGGFNSSQSFKKDSNVQEYIIRQSSLKCAIDLVVAEKIEAHEWEKMANSFVEWVYGKQQVKEMPSFAEKSPF